MLSKRKKAIMGIGTLIIFIATILVAAVAAGVLISTSGVLQQRALITGQEARKKITNAIEVISITAYGNKSDESINNFETLIRLDAGSDPTQMKKFDVSFIGPNSHAGAKLMMPSLNNYLKDPNGFIENITTVTDTIENTTIYSVRDLDEDGESEELTLYSPMNEMAYFIVNFTSYDADYANVSLEMDISNLSGIYHFRNYDLPIIGQDNEWYGYLSIDGNITANSTLDVDNAASVTLSRYFTKDCEFDVIPPETYYCFEVMHGDDDEVLGDGEVFMVKMRLDHSNRLFISQEFQFIFSSEKGRMSRALARTPDIIQTTRVPLWPVG